MSDPLRYQCAYCQRKRLDRDDIPRHEARCEWKAIKQECWRVTLRIAYERERTHGTGQ